MRKSFIITFLLAVPFCYMQAEYTTSLTSRMWQQSKQEYTKPIHYVGIGAKVGYSQFGMKTEDFKNPGGANAGIELRYKLEYNMFRFTAGLDATYAGNSFKGDYTLERAVLEPSTDMTYRYNFHNLVEKESTFEVGVPILFGADYKGYYAMGGIRLGLPVAKSYKLKTDLDITCADSKSIEAEYINIPSHGLVSSSVENSGKLSLQTINPQIALEVGMNLDRWLVRQRRMRVNDNPRTTDLLHYEVALYSNIGVTDYKTASDGRFCTYNGVNNSITQDKEIAVNKMIPWNIGARMNVYFEFYKKPKRERTRRRPKPQPKPQVEVVDTIVPEVIIPQDTIVFQGDTIMKGDTIEMQRIYFDTNKSELLKRSFVSVDSLANLMKAHENIKISLVGHTDNTGNAEFNMTLSENRAAAVKQALISRGVDESRIKSYGKGMTQPIADNSTREGRAMNRRVEIIFEEQ